MFLNGNSTMSHLFVSATQARQFFGLIATVLFILESRGFKWLCENEYCMTTFLVEIVVARSGPRCRKIKK